MNKLEVSTIPLLASPQGGVAERPSKVAKQPLIARPGGFSDGNKWKTTPVASASVASRNFLDDATTPPCGDARRGIPALLQFIHSFYEGANELEGSQFVKSEPSDVRCVLHLTRLPADQTTVFLFIHRVDSAADRAER